MKYNMSSCYKNRKKKHTIIWVIFRIVNEFENENCMFELQPFKKE